MSVGLSALSPPLYSSSSSCISSKTQIIITRSCCNLSWSSQAAAAYVLPRTSGVNLKPRITSLRCNSSNRPGDPSPPGENENRTILDAFFLGKALAEALNERIESTVGEFFSTIGRLQAEQQKQVQDFQEEVLERAKKSKEKAAREAMELQGLIPKSSINSTTVSSASDAPSISNNTPNSSVLTSDKGHNPTSTNPHLEGSTDD